MARKEMKRRSKKKHTTPSAEQVQSEAAALSPQTKPNNPEKTLSYSLLEELSSGQASELTSAITGIIEVVMNVTEPDVPLPTRIAAAASSLIAARNSQKSGSLFFPEFEPKMASTSLNEDAEKINEVNNPQMDVINASEDSSKNIDTKSVEQITLTRDEQVVNTENDALNEKLKTTPKRKKKISMRQRLRLVFEEAMANAVYKPNEPSSPKKNTEDETSQKNTPELPEIVQTEEQTPSTPMKKTPPKEESTISESDHSSKTESGSSIQKLKKKPKPNRNVGSKAKVSLKFEITKSDELAKLNKPGTSLSPEQCPTKLASIEEDVKVENNSEDVKTGVGFIQSSPEQAKNLKEVIDLIDTISPISKQNNPKENSIEESKKSSQMKSDVQHITTISQITKETKDAQSPPLKIIDKNVNELAIDKPDEMTKDESSLILDPVATENEEPEIKSSIAEISDQSFIIPDSEKDEFNVPPLTMITSDVFRQTTKRRISTKTSSAAIKVKEMFKKTTAVYKEALLKANKQLSKDWTFNAMGQDRLNNDAPKKEIKPGNLPLSDATLKEMTKEQFSVISKEHTATSDKLKDFEPIKSDRLEGSPDISSQRNQKLEEVKLSEDQSSDTAENKKNKSSTENKNSTAVKKVAPKKEIKPGNLPLSDATLKVMTKEQFSVISKEHTATSDKLKDFEPIESDRSKGSPDISSQRNQELEEVKLSEYQSSDTAENKKNKSSTENKNSTAVKKVAPKKEIKPGNLPLSDATLKVMTKEQFSVISKEHTATSDKLKDFEPIESDRSKGSPDISSQRNQELEEVKLSEYQSSDTAENKKNKSSTENKNSTAVKKVAPKKEIKPGNLPLSDATLKVMTKEQFSVISKEHTATSDKLKDFEPIESDRSKGSPDISSQRNQELEEVKLSEYQSSDTAENKKNKSSTENKNSTAVKKVAPKKEIKPGNLPLSDATLKVMTKEQFSVISKEHTATSDKLKDFEPIESDRSKGSPDISSQRNQELEEVKLSEYQSSDTAENKKNKSSTENKNSTAVKKVAPKKEIKPGNLPLSDATLKVMTKEQFSVISKEHTATSDKLKDFEPIESDRSKGSPDISSQRNQELEEVKLSEDQSSDTAENKGNKSSTENKNSTAVKKVARKKTKFSDEDSEDFPLMKKTKSSAIEEPNSPTSSSKTKADKGHKDEMKKIETNLPQKYFVVEYIKEISPTRSCFQTVDSDQTPDVEKLESSESTLLKNPTEFVECHTPNYCGEGAIRKKRTTPQEQNKRRKAPTSIQIQSFQNPNVTYTFNPNEKHPLVTAWTLWFYEKRMGNWRESLKEVATFDTSEDLWLLYNHLLLPSELPAGWDFCVFRNGIRPLWEDPKNRHGGKWEISFQLVDCGDQLNRRWINTLFFIASEMTAGYKEVCGVVLSTRKGVNKIAMWTQNSNHSQTNMIIGHDFKDMLNASSAKCTYHVHTDTAQRSKKYIHHI